MCRCSDYTGGCDCSCEFAVMFKAFPDSDIMVAVNCKSHMAGCRKCSKEKCLLCAAPQYFVCPGDESCNPFCKNNCNGHKCDIDTGNYSLEYSVCGSFLGSGQENAHVMQAGVVTIVPSPTAHCVALGTAAARVATWQPHASVMPVTLASTAPLTRHRPRHRHHLLWLLLYLLPCRLPRYTSTSPHACGFPLRGRRGLYHPRCRRAHILHTGASTARCRRCSVSSRTRSQALLLQHRCRRRRLLLPPRTHCKLIQQMHTAPSVPLRWTGVRAAHTLRLVPPGEPGDRGCCSWACRQWPSSLPRVLLARRRWWR